MNDRPREMIPTLQGFENECACIYVCIYMYVYINIDVLYILYRN